MSFVTAAQNAKTIAARNKIDRLLSALPADEAQGLEELLTNRGLSLEKVSAIIREEGESALPGVPACYFDVSPSAVKRWRNTNLPVSTVNGL